jgi:hypothetical protein
MRSLVLLLAALPVAAQPKIDNVLVRMVPPGTTSLVGANMDRMKATPFYKKLVEQQRMPQVDAFAAETGFDPRRDVRELLYAATPDGSVLLARGRFKLAADPTAHAKLVRHGVYNIWTTTGNDQTAGFCILDGTLAAAGQLKAVEAALDEWTKGTHKAAQPLLALGRTIVPATHLWGVSTGFASFLASTLPKGGGRGGIDFSKIFAGMKSSWFQSDFTSGVNLELHGNAATEPDAVSLRDMAKGLIGFGRLNVPENQPELLKLWDGITVEQAATAVTIKADIALALVDRLVQMLNGRPDAQSTGRGRVQL